VAATIVGVLGFVFLVMHIYVVYKIIQDDLATGVISLFCAPVAIYAFIQNKDNIGVVFWPYIFLQVFFVAIRVNPDLILQYDRPAVQAEVVEDEELYEEALEEVEPIEEEPVAVSYTPDPKGYEEHCSGCHDSGLAGAPKPTDKERWTSIFEQRSIHDVMLNAYQGRGGHPKKGGCDTCSVNMIEKMSFHIISSSGAAYE